MGQLQLLLTNAVFLEGSAGAVGLEDVEFDREAQLGPVDVELVSGLVPASCGVREACLREGLQEAPLEAGAAERRRLIEAESAAERLRSPVAFVSSEDRFERRQVDQPPFFAALEDLRDAVFKPPVPLGEGSRVMEANARMFFAG